jgi:C4-dicarboxylate transporter DctM subunit
MNGIIGVIALLVLLTLGVPIGVAMGVVGFVGLTLLIGFEPALIKSGVVLFETVLKYELGVLPLFLLMAHFCFAAGASRDFFDAAARWIGHRRGGLALASVAGCAGFGAISGSSLATAATIGLVGLPEMRRRGYSDALATGSIAAGGTLGSLIPPSGALIVFGILAEQSIGTLFTAAIIPGITQALFYMVTIVLLCRWRPSIGPATEKASWPERRAALLRVIDLATLILIVIGGIALGWFTPTEAASIGALGALLLCVRRKQLTFDALRNALAETLRTAGMIYVVIVGALIFSVFMSVTGLAEQVASVMSSLGGGQLTAIIVMTVLLLLLGSVLDGLALMLLTTPILMPIIVQLGLSPIWFGVYLVRTMELGFVHPPIGMNLYVIQGIAKDVPLARIFKGVVPFLAADFAHLALLIAVPQVVLFLPQWLGS